MHRCRIAAWLVGVVVWGVAYAVVSLVICVIFVLPFLFVLALDALVGERRAPNVIKIAPPAPPQRPKSVAFATRRAA
jgi:hypothetical protein